MVSTGNGSYTSGGSWVGSPSITKAGTDLFALAGTSTFTGSVNLTNGVIQLGATNTLSGTVTISGAGILKGDGTVGKIVAAVGGGTPNGTIAPATSATTPMTLNVSGTVNFANGLTYNPTLISLSGAKYDVLKVTGNATLTGGTLTLNLGTGFTSNPGDSYTILTASSLMGTVFSNAPNGGTFLTGGTNFTITYTANSVIATVDSLAATVSVTSVSPNPSVYGQSITIHGTVASMSGSGGTPTGSISIYDDTNMLLLGSGTLTGGAFSIATTAALTAGMPPLLVDYSGDSNFGTANDVVNNAVTINQANTQSVITSNPMGSSAYGQTATFTVTVSDTSLPSLAGTLAPTGTVTLTITNSVGTVVTMQTLSLAGGVATYSPAGLGLPVGNNYTIAASYSGDGNYNISTATPLTFSVTQDSSVTTLGLSTSASSFGQPVILTAMVSSGPPGSGTPTGTVIFKDGAIPLNSTPIALVNGVATLTIYNFSVGMHSLTVSYSGDANYLYSDSTGSPQSLTVAASAVTTTLMSSPNPSAYGAPIKFTATVGSSVGYLTPTGTVNFTDNGNPLATNVMLVNGTAIFTTTVPLPVSTVGDNIAATYVPDANSAGYTAGTPGTVVQVINEASTSTALTSSLPGTSLFVQPITFTATVTNSDSSLVPTGNVTFTITPQGGMPFSPVVVPLVSGVATYSVSAGSLPLNNYTIAAAYADTSAPPSFVSSSNSISQSVETTTTTSLQSSLSPSTLGHPVTFTSVVTAGPGGNVPTGFVNFVIDSNPAVQVMLSGGVATLQISTLTQGAHTITATFVPSANLFEQPSTSPALTQNVKANTSLAVSTSSSPAQVGQTVTLSAVVTAPGSVPTGPVTFTDTTTGTVLGIAYFNASDVASVNATFVAGSHNISISFAGDALFNPSANSLILPVNVASDTMTLTQNESRVFTGDTLTFTAQVTIAAGLSFPFGPSGTVTFTDATTGIVLGTAPVTTSGQAVLQYSALEVGNHTVVATYGGDANYASNSASTTLNVEESIFVVTPDAGGGPDVKVYDAKTDQLKFSFFAFDPNFTGGVRVAVGDVNGDGVPDIICSAGPGGGPNVTIFDGNNGNRIASFMAYNPYFFGGVYVAAGDVTGGGYADIICGPDQGGGPNVTVFDGKSVLNGGTPNPVQNFEAFNPNFTGGIRVAAGDVNGDGKADIIVGAGPGGGPSVAVFNGVNDAAIYRFFAYAPTFNAGIYVGAGDVNGDGYADIIVGSGAGGGPNVTVFSGANGAEIANFFAYNPNFFGGVRVAGVVTKANGEADILVGPGPGSDVSLPPFIGKVPQYTYPVGITPGGPQIALLDGVTDAAVDSFFAYNPLFSGGVYVAGTD